MQGFFSHKQTISKVAKPTGKVLSCVTCRLDQSWVTGGSTPTGDFKKKVLIIDDKPSNNNRLLKQTLNQLGFDLFEDCYKIGVINCNSESSPTNIQIDCCRKYVIKVIEKYKPKVIILLGAFPLYSIIGGRWKKDLGTISKWRGFCIPDQDYKCWICPTFSLQEIERAMSWNKSQSDPVELLIWSQDLKRAFDCLKQDFPLYIDPKIDIIENLQPLEKLTQMGKLSIAFDYETTGLKPQAEGHKIVCASVAYSPGHAYVFMMPETRKERRPFINLLLNPEIGKMAHNMKFEQIWTAEKLDILVINWQWDSMQAAHILDNRPGVTSLKFQVYINFGIIDYASEVSPYLEGIGDSANSFNRILEFIKLPGGKEKLLKYCALDSIYELRLAKKQQEIMEYDKNYFKSL